jgi:hypothetical protein
MLNSERLEDKGPQYMWIGRHHTYEVHLAEVGACLSSAARSRPAATPARSCRDFFLSGLSPTLRTRTGGTGTA